MEGKDCHRTHLACAVKRTIIVIIALCLQKQQSEASLYAVTDDDATIAYLLEKMREMDPEGVGIVRSEFKRYTLKRMHSGNLRQNHRLWRRLQTKMQKLGVLELDVHTVSLCCSSQDTTHPPARHSSTEAHGQHDLDLLQSNRHCFGRGCCHWHVCLTKNIAVVHTAVRCAMCQSLLWLASGSCQTTVAQTAMLG